MKNQSSTAKRHVAIYGSHEGKTKRWELEIDENNPEDLKALKLAVKHPPKRCFPCTPRSNATLGDWYDYICKIDLDNCFTKSQPKIAGYLINNRFSMDGFRIYQSGIKTIVVKDEDRDRIVYKYRLRGYHIVFNRKVTPMENKAIKSWFYMHIKCFWNTVEMVDIWMHMQDIKQTDTLRVGFKGKKKPPKTVFKDGNQDKMIAEFEDNRNFILNFLAESDSSESSKEEKRGD